MFLKGLADLAAKTGHPELTTVPWCLWGHSDGQELAQAPKTPVGKYGRPLIQSMTYQDTPSKPLPET